MRASYQPVDLAAVVTTVALMLARSTSLRVAKKFTPHTPDTGALAMAVLPAYTFNTVAPPAARQSASETLEGHRRAAQLRLDRMQA